MLVRPRRRLAPPQDGQVAAERPRGLLDRRAVAEMRALRRHEQGLPPRVSTGPGTPDGRERADDPPRGRRRGGVLPLPSADGDGRRRPRCRDLPLRRGRRGVQVVGAESGRQVRAGDGSLGDPRPVRALRRGVDRLVRAGGRGGRRGDVRDVRAGGVLPRGVRPLLPEMGQPGARRLRRRAPARRPGPSRGVPRLRPPRRPVPSVPRPADDPPARTSRSCRAPGRPPTRQAFWSRARATRRA